MPNTTIIPDDIDSPDFMECKLEIADEAIISDDKLKDSSVIEKVTPAGIKIHIKTESSYTTAKKSNYTG